MDILLNTPLGGYTLLRAIGSGGMGTVYLAEDLTIGQQVAIKVVHTDPGAYSDTDSMQPTRRFRQEARAVASLDHLHILPLYRYGEEETVGGQHAYMVMQYRPEGSMWDWLRRRAGLGSAESLASAPHFPAGLHTSWPLSVEEAGEYLRQAASALQYAHDRGIIHRDVKPANFLLRFDTASPTDANTSGKASHHVFLLLSDFGLAKMFSSNSSASHVLGTPTYMAPEQFEGVAVPASDQYALAVMIYLLLAGHPPFEGDPMYLMHQHLTAPPPPLHNFAPDVPPDIEHVLRRALAKKPDERYPSITEFANAFNQSLYDEQVSFRSFAPSLSLPAVTRDSRKMFSLSAPASGSVGASSPSDDYSEPAVASSSPVSSSPNYPAFLQPLSPLQNTPTIREADAAAPTLYPALPAASAQQTPIQDWTLPPASVNGPLLSPTQSQLQMPVPSDGNRTSRRGALAWILGGATVLTLGAGFYIYQRLVPQQVKFVLTGHSAEVTDIAWSPDGTQMASTSSDATVRLWNSDTQQTTFTYHQHSAAVLTVAWSPHGAFIASGGRDRTVQIWKPSGARQHLYVNLGILDTLAWSANAAQLFVGGFGGGFHEISLSNSHVTRIGMQAVIHALAVSPSGRYLAIGGQNGSVALLDLQVPGHPKVYHLHSGAILSLAWSPNSTMLASGGADNTAIVLDTRSGRRLHTLPHGGVVNGLAWEPAGTNRLATACADSTVNVWGMDSSVRAIYHGHTGTVTSVAWGTRGLASGSVDKTIIVWNT